MPLDLNGSGEVGNVWPPDAFPHYIQSTGADFCRSWESAFPGSQQEGETYEYVTKKGNMIWETIR